MIAIGEKVGTHDFDQSVVKAHVASRLHLQQPSIGFQSHHDRWKGLYDIGQQCSKGSVLLPCPYIKGDSPVHHVIES